MIRFAALVLVCTSFTACLTAHDKEVWTEAKNIMSVGPKTAFTEEKKPVDTKAPVVSDASDNKDEVKKTEKAVTR